MYREYFDGIKRTGDRPMNRDRERKKERDWRKELLFYEFIIYIRKYRAERTFARQIAIRMKIRNELNCYSEQPTVLFEPKESTFCS